MNIWHTFIGGIIQIRALPRQQFGALQARTFPKYFAISSCVSYWLLATWIFKHPDVPAQMSKYSVADVAQAWTLIFVGVMQTLNWAYLGPKTAVVMFKRHKLEKAENKSYRDADISEEMKAVNKEFSALHGWGSLTNLIAILGMTFHGLWIAKYGIHGY